MFSNSIMEICWITTLHYKALHNLSASISTNSKYIGNSYYFNLCCPANFPSSRLQSLDPRSVWSQSCNHADGLSRTCLLHTTNSLTTNKACGHIYTNQQVMKIRPILFWNKFLQFYCTWNIVTIFHTQLPFVYIVV